jgi:hypothetical protein
LEGSDSSHRGIGVASTDQIYYSGPKDSSSRVTIQVTPPKEEQDYRSYAKDSDFYQYSTSAKKIEPKGDFLAFPTYPPYPIKHSDFYENREVIGRNMHQKMANHSL